MTTYYKVVDAVDNHIVLAVGPGESIEIQDDAARPEAHIELMLSHDAHAVYKGAFVVSSGGVKRTVTIHCRGTGSTAAASITCFTAGSATFSLQTYQHHAACASLSTVRVQGVSADRSRASVESSIVIDERIAGIEARQVHRHLLLDEGARAVSVPALDILSDDVSCSHGAAITYLDPLQLFYLNARGYNHEEAREAIIKAFLAL